MTIHNEAPKKRTDLKKREAAIYTRKTAIYEGDKELNDNVTQRLMCTVIIKFNIEDELSVSLKRYDENIYDECDEDDIENRPALQELFKDIRDGLVDTVIVYAMSILSTSLKTVDKIARFFKEQNVRVILGNEGVDTLMPSGRRFFLHIAELVQYESMEGKPYFKDHDEQCDVMMK